MGSRSYPDPNPYKRTCPTCGQPAIGRERRIGGTIYCENGHEWQDPGELEELRGN